MTILKELDLKQPQSVDPSDLIKSFEVIPIKSNDIFGEVNFIRLVDDKIIIADNQIGHRIWVIDKKSGQHLASISSRGSGPMEYKKIDHITVTNDSILILSPKKVLTYDLNGKFVSEQRHSVYPSCFAYQNGHYFFNGVNNQILINDDTKYNLIKTDSDFNPIQKFLPYESEDSRNNYELNDPFQQFNDLVVFIQSMDLNVYQINGNKLEVRYELNFENQISPSYLEKRLEGIELVEYLSSQDIVWTLDNFIETDDFLIIAFRNGSTPTTYIYDKNTDQTSFINPSQNNLWLAWLLLNPLGSEGNTLYGSIEAGDFEAFADFMEEESPFYNGFAQIADSLSIQSNPLIVKIELGD